MSRRALMVAAFAGVLGAGSASGSPLGDPGFNEPPAPIAAQLFSRVYSALCSPSCGRVVLFRNRTATIAGTQTFPNGGSVIAYEPQTLTWLYNNVGEGAVIGIFAHELGHHVDTVFNRASWIDSSWGRELRADAWAGCALARLGLSTSQTAYAIQAISAFPSPTHPSWHERLPALQLGYSQCGGGAFSRWPTTVKLYEIPAE